ncbi:hypothetical protein BJV85_003496 [Clostridium acetobutylicum]|uniref:DUF1540 domain-containing protein n=1 Tax=Clostridium acetobutylicum (strain ATCC 824 / DSM 792 / JCM 1419 / IAM 19013 / LMG 5710 / NBRC 13948 / NRRL B-527 / VKM B-1787 / 2291 / W) TaxID=272562 RepID=Q97LN6_CLOAB|nr:MULTISPECIES: DUF1540 domain-containing protein [Clostridium]AAK78500.1 Hypothetical protein CA_C0521 [Clostridium acetobutylicum ATCC 824]ADZ19571.1 Conserved hypothetical protein [Clostridium acetobutylicum EA 2018]AEI31285.1 hypothetical protein SMB_G0531 [Clostridium acetobutylicum DSM 1731]AWV80222.1 DUF1540 domain-containing protein [Clostridium acetobutylicum]KHD37708.1 hypothetical protein NL50_05895 [Clostridium acetobutylicum]
MATKLMCSAGTCVNNISGLCTAKTINVHGIKARSSIDTECETFAEKGIKNALSNLVNMNIPGEIRQVFSRNSIEMSPEIQCQAINCSYNHNKLCAARNVQIYGPGAITSEGTECETFTSKS